METECMYTMCVLCLRVDSYRYTFVQVHNTGILYDTDIRTISIITTTTTNNNNNNYIIIVLVLLHY